MQKKRNNMDATTLHATESGRARRGAAEEQERRRPRMSKEESEVERRRRLHLKLEEKERSGLRGESAWSKEGAIAARNVAMAAMKKIGKRAALADLLWPEGRAREWEKQWIEGIVEELGEETRAAMTSRIQFAIARIIIGNGSRDDIKRRAHSMWNALTRAANRVTLAVAKKVEKRGGMRKAGASSKAKVRRSTAAAIGSAPIWDRGELMEEQLSEVAIGLFKKGMLVKRVTGATVSAAAKAWETANVPGKLLIGAVLNEREKRRLRELGGTALYTTESWKQEGWEEEWSTGMRCTYTRSMRLCVLHEDDRNNVWSAALASDEIASTMGVAMGENERLRKGLRAMSEGQATKLLAQGVHMPSARGVIATALKLCKGNRLTKANIMSIGSGMGMLERAVEENGVEIQVKVAVEFNKKCVKAHRAAWKEHKIRYVGAIGSMQSVEEIVEATDGEKMDMITLSLQCSPYSFALRMKKKGAARAWRLETARRELSAAAAVIRRLKPRIVIYENVGTILGKGWEEEWGKIKQILAGAGMQRWIYQAIRPERKFRDGVRRHRLWMVGLRS